MNGKVMRRIRRAAYQVMFSGHNGRENYPDSYHDIVKQLKREYRALPYHKRNPDRFGYANSHAQQRKRWQHMRGIK